MASPYQRTPFGTSQPIDLENINRGFNQNQQATVYVPPEDRRMQNGTFQGQEMEDMHYSGM